MATQACSHRRRLGFTLIEMLIVITVIAILALVAIPRIMAASRSAKEAQLRGNLKQLRDAIEHFEATMAAWPPSLADVMAASGDDISADLDGSGGWVDRNSYDGPYLVTGDEQLPADPFTETADWNYNNATGDIHSSGDLTARNGSAYNTW